MPKLKIKPFKHGDRLRWPKGMSKLKQRQHMTDPKLNELLLAALEATLSCIDQHTSDEVLGPIIEQAKTAIAKAKGK